MSHHILASANIEVGVHRTVTLFGFALNIDTIWTTAIAGAIVIGLGLALRRGVTKAGVTKAVPTKVQVFWETIVETIEAQVEENIGKPPPFMVPLAVTIFVFILVANWLELLPSDGYLRSPSADVNFTYALALLVIIWAHMNGVRHVGFRHYIKHVFFPPGRPAWLAPFNLIEEIVRPFTLALRLFGNMLAGGIMLSVIALLPFYITPALGEAAWDLFDMFIGLIQAGIFALLTILYFGFALESKEEEAQLRSIHTKSEVRASGRNRHGKGNRSRGRVHRRRPPARRWCHRRRDRRRSRRQRHHQRCRQAAGSADPPVHDLLHHGRPVRGDVLHQPRIHGPVSCSCSANRSKRAPCHTHLPAATS